MIGAIRFFIVFATLAYLAAPISTGAPIGRVLAGSAVVADPGDDLDPADCSRGVAESNQESCSQD